MNVEDDMHDEHVNEIFTHCIFEEIKHYSNIMLQQIDHENHNMEESMWQQPTFLEDVEDMLRQPGIVKDLHQQMKSLKFEQYNKTNMRKQFRGYKIWKKRRRKPNLVESQETSL